MSKYSRLSRAIRDKRELRMRGLLPPYMLGKKKARRDKRNILFARILRELPALPDQFSVIPSLPIEIPTPMFANNEWGDCVMAARGHQTLMFEASEQRVALKIKDEEVLEEYWDNQSWLCRCLSPHPDKGLVLLNAMKDWRSDGWIAAGRRYNIFAFAELNALDRDEVAASIYLLMGGQVGIRLPKTAKDQFENGEPWEIVPNGGPDAIPGSWGGHGVCLEGYNDFGVTCITWATRQAMSWDFFMTCCDEGYGVVDNRDDFLPDSPVDVEKLERYLEEITR